MTLQFRALTPGTTDPTSRTVEAIVSTGADVERAGFVERLPLANADLERFIGAPVLDAHRTGSTRDQLGVVEAAEVRTEGLWARLRFRSGEAAAAVLADISDGTLRGLSIGYVATYRETREGGRRVRIAETWSPREVSIVPVPADPGAHFRSEKGVSTMEQTTETTTTETGTQDERQTRADANREIRQIATTAGLTRAWADDLIDREAEPEVARREAFEAMQTRSAETQTRTARAHVTTDHTDPAVIAQRAGEALYARSHGDHELSEPARQYAGMTTGDLARDCLHRAGVRTTTMATDSLVTRALHSTSDFPLILGDTVNRELRRGYETAPSGIRPAARQTTIRDFRKKRSLVLGEFSELAKVGEGGEFKSGTIDEAGETYKLETYGRILAISRQALVNDDLGAFSDPAAKLGQAARQFEAKTLADLVVANPAMSDSETVFSAAHGNVETTASVPSVTALTAARLAMRKQTGLSGQFINVVPRFLIVGPDMETIAEKALAELAAAKVDDVNPFSGRLTLLVEPRLPAGHWYVAADPAVISGLEYATLEGSPGPQIETRAGFEVDGVQIRVRLDFGAGWVDHRPWFKHSSA